MEDTYAIWFLFFLLLFRISRNTTFWLWLLYFHFSLVTSAAVLPSNGSLCGYSLYTKQVIACL